MYNLVKNVRGGSRFIGPDGTADAAARLAAGGAYDRRGDALPPGWQVSEPHTALLGHAQLGGGHRQRQRQRPTLAGTMQKALAEATLSAGGVLVPVEVSTEIVELVRQRVAVMTMGPRVVPVEKEL